LTIEELIAWIYFLTQNYGYLGAAILSFLSSLILFIPIPYLLIVFGLSAPSFGLNPVVLALVSALGATLGKIVIYYIGVGGRKLLGEERRKRLEFGKLVVGKYGALAIFIFAVTPLPDDVLYIPLGLIGYNVLNFFLYCFLGKFLMTLVVTLGGEQSLAWSSRFFMERRGNIIGVVMTLILIVVSVYATIKIDWEKLFLKYAPKTMKVLKKLEDIRKTREERRRV
jgi:membrane protein YqaA with SNARE-associated domain